VSSRESERKGDLNKVDPESERLSIKMEGVKAF